MPHFGELGSMKKKNSFYIMINYVKVNLSFVNSLAGLEKVHQCGEHLRKGKAQYN